MIKVLNLNKYYNRHTSNEIHVINDTTVEFDNTGLVCILGESGSGKTTLMNAIGGLDDFNSGEMTIEESTVKGYKARTMDKIRNEHYGYIFQNYYLLQDRTVYYNIALALSMYKLTPAEIEERILYVLKAVNMEKYRKRKISQLSGGQQQRVAIARALAKTPNVIFADEPTGNLDEKNTIQIMNIIKKVSKDCLVILVTHERNIAEFYADRIINVADGKIISDQVINANGTYTYEDDNNIYLQDMKMESQTNDETSDITIYSDESSKNKKIKLNIIYKNGHVLISSPDKNANVEFLASNDERHVIDGHKPVMTREDVEEFEYNLNKLESKKAPKLGFKEVLKLAYNNFKGKAKRNVFMYISLIATAVITMVAAGDLMSIVNYDKTTISNYSNNALKISMQSTAIGGQKDLRFKELVTSFVNNDDDNVDVQPVVTSTNYTFYCDDYEQLTATSMDLRLFNIFDSKYLKDDDIYLGRNAKTIGEIVVNKAILENAINGDSVVSSFYPTPESFLGGTIKNVFASYGRYEKANQYTIVGICDTNDCASFVTRESLVSFGGLGFTFATLSTLKADYPGVYDDITLEDNHILASGQAIASFERNGTYAITTESDLFNQTLYIDNVQNRGEENEKTYELPGGYFANIIIPDDQINDYLMYEATSLGSCFVYSTTNNKADITKALDDYNASLTSERITISDSYEEALKEYEETKASSLAITGTICVIVLLVSILILYFTMKANSLKRIYDIGVYRSIGISKTSIIGSFIIEMLLISTCSTLLGGLAAYLVIQLIGSIPMLSINVGLTFGYFVIVEVFLYLINILIGLAPINKLLRMTPARLTAKYDM